MTPILLAATAAIGLGPWQRVLDTAVDEAGRLDHVLVARDPGLKSWLRQVASATEPSDPAARTAFSIHAYNALTVELVATAWPIDSIREIDHGKVWNTRTFTVAGQAVTLDQIETRLRAVGDPRVHAALNCASLGCPPPSRHAYTGPELDAQLDAAARRWMATNGVHIDRSKNQVAFSRIFKWYGDDFESAWTKAGAPDIPGLAGHAEAAAWFAARYRPQDAAWLRSGGYAVTWTTYDWRVNAR